MKLRATLIETVEAFMAKHRLSERQFGLAAAGDHKFVAKLRNGGGTTLTVIERVEAYMASRDSGNNEAAA